MAGSSKPLQWPSSKARWRGCICCWVCEPGVIVFPRRLAMNRKLLSLLAGAALGSSSPVFAQSTKAPAGMKLSDNVVKIGVLTDLSGLYSDLAGSGAVTAAKMAVED